MSADMHNPPMPENELAWLFTLSEFDLDYDNLDNNFKDLTRLAAKVAGTEISMVNLIDLYTQWTVSKFGIQIKQMAREDSVCQYTIMQDKPFEITDLAVDERFKNKDYVTGSPNLKYYYGIPLKTDEEHNIGALCVMDTEKAEITPEKTEMLKIIADEIVNRLKALKAIESLKTELNEATESKRRVAHDIRGPIGGIIGLARVISEQGDENTLDEVLEFIGLIQKSGHSLLELADEILSAECAKPDIKLSADEFNQLLLKDKLEKLYAPQAVNKNISFSVTVSADTEKIPFSKNKLLQIIGNLISNSMKFTPNGGKVSVKLSIHVNQLSNNLHIVVEDTGIGMDKVKVEEILNGKAISTDGTKGEQGYGFGLALVKHLVEGLKGHMYIASEKGFGTTIEITLPQVKP